MIDVMHVYRASHQECRSFQDRPTEEQQAISRKRSMEIRQDDEIQKRGAVSGCTFHLFPRCNPPDYQVQPGF